jgi:hypothetical protein
MMSYVFIIIVHFFVFVSPCRENDDEHAIHHHFYKKIKLAFGKNKRTTISCVLIVIIFLFWSIYAIVKKMTTNVQLVVVFFLNLHFVKKLDDNELHTCRCLFSLLVYLYHCKKDDDEHATCIISHVSSTCFLASSRYDKILVRWVIPIVREIVLPNIPQFGSTFTI